MGNTSQIQIRLDTNSVFRPVGELRQQSQFTDTLYRPCRLSRELPRTV